MQKRISNIIILTIIIAVITMLCLYFAITKKGFHTDELWTFGISNSSTGNLYPEEIQTNIGKQGWVSGTFFQEYLTVNFSERFCYSNIIKNATADTHPILYYFILHTICSLFPGRFSKWLGIVPNILFLIVSLVFLYKIGQIVFNDKRAALAPLILWGGSAACINNVVFIRMYMLLTMFYILSTYYFLKFMLKKTFRLIDYIFLSLVISGGLLTDYTYLPYIGLLGLFFMFYIVIYDKKSRLIQIFFCVLLSLFMVLAIYPYYFNVLFQSLFTHGANSGFAEKIKLQTQNFSIFFTYFNKLSFGGYITLLFVLMFVIQIYSFCSRRYLWIPGDKNEVLGILTLKEGANKSELKITKKNYAISAIFVALSISFYIIARAANWNDMFGSRIIYPLCPIAVFLFCFWLNNILSLHIAKNTTKLINGIMVCMSLLSLIKVGLIWSFPEQSEAVEYVTKEKRDLIWAYYPDIWSDLYVFAPVLKNIDEIYFLDLTKLEITDINGILELRETKDAFDVCFQAWNNSPFDQKESNANDIASKAGYNSVAINDRWLGYGSVAFTISNQ